MKKYAIILGENNRELCRSVQEALFAAGFKWRGVFGAQDVIHVHARALVLNRCKWGEISYSSDLGRGDFDALEREVDGDVQLIRPSYATMNAAYLDGAQAPWDIAPDNYRLVSKKDRQEYEHTENTNALFYNRTLKRWQVSSFGPHFDTWKDENPDILAYAVPEDYVFEMKEVEVPVSDLVAEYEKQHGIKVKVQK